MKNAFSPVDFLKKLISCTPCTADIPAVNRVSALVRQKLQELDLFVQEESVDGRHTLFAATHPGKTAGMLFNAHMDVVPLTTPDQAIPRQEGALLYGRGANDCLGSIVAIMEILRRNPECDCGAIFTADEETGGNTTRQMLLRGYRPTKAAIILDGWGEGNLVSAEKGSMDVTVRLRGKSGHSAYPWTAVNALELLMQRYAALRETWRNPTREDNWENSIAATTVDSSSTAHNIIPGEAAMHLNIRFISEQDRQDILQKLKDAMGPEAEITTDSLCAPVVNDERNPFLQKALETAGKYRRHPVKFRTMNGATDARHFAEILPEIPLLIDGIRGDNLHGADEWTDLDSMEETIRLYSALLHA